MAHTPSVRRPHPIDIHVGKRLRAGRTLAGYSQERLGEAVGLSFQQIQKYEKGYNRIGASRLQQFAKLLNVPPAYFFEGGPQADGTEAAPADGQLSLPEDGAISTRQALELVRYFGAVKDERFRQSFFNLVKAIAQQYELQAATPEPATVMMDAADLAAD